MTDTGRIKHALETAQANAELIENSATETDAIRAVEASLKLAHLALEDTDADLRYTVEKRDDVDDGPGDMSVLPGGDALREEIEPDCDYRIPDVDTTQEVIDSYDTDGIYDEPAVDWGMDPQALDTLARHAPLLPEQPPIVQPPQYTAGDWVYDGTADSYEDIGHSLDDVEIESFEDLSLGLDELTETYSEHQESVYCDAVRETDWSETAVLRIVERWTPSEQLAREPMTMPRAEYEIERYAERAPPISTHADDGSAEVATITKPLLERIAMEFEGVEDLLGDTDD